MSCCLHLQTAHGKQAEALVGREYYDELTSNKRQFLPWIDRTIKQFPQSFPEGRSSVRLLMDNGPAHQWALKDNQLLDGMHLVDSARVQHPPESYDFQLPIEWSFGVLKTKARDYLYSHPEVATRDEVYAVLCKVWKEQFTPEVVQAMFRKQLLALHDIVKNQGGYAKVKHS
jgi:hypothetical protein